LHPGIHAAHQGDKIAYCMAESGETVTYKQLNKVSNQTAHLFRHESLKPGDGIAILLHNHVSYLQITWAAQRSGLYYTPISTFFQSAEIEYILKNSDAKMLITAHQYLERLNLAELSGLKIYLVDDSHDEIPYQIQNWQQAIDQFPGTSIPDECEGAEMIYSSGTTGVPKGVRFPLQQSALGTVSTLFKTRVRLHDISDRTRYLSTAPLYHSAPLRYNMMVTRLGGSSTIMQKFDAAYSLRLIEQFKVTHSQWVPTMFVRLLKLPEKIKDQHDVSSLEYVIHAAAPCPIEIKQRMIDWFGPKLYEYYSGTEANGSTAITSEEWLSHKGSVGRAIHGELHILGDDGNELSIGEQGTVYFANGSDFSYYKDPEKTAEVKTAHGLSTLGDMGYVDHDGYLYLKDRKSFMIISGGVNIYPQEIENLLITHEAVADVAVIGVPNSEFGEEVKAVVQLLAPEHASEELATELIQYCRNRISHVKCPRSVDFIEQLPRHPTGKLYKSRLKDEYWPAKATHRP